jgi:MoaA/NifB/PqqE/SkfB family radical SAM enzyme
MLISYPFRFLMNNLKRTFNSASSPFLLNYSVTLRCILDCKYCGVSRLNNNFATEELTAKDIALFLKDRMLKKLKVIVISGGEPFLKNDLSEILLEFKKRISPDIFHITTNGFLTEEIIESVKFLKKNGLNIEIKISIDDISDRHDLLRNRKGSFEKAVQTIQKLRSIFDRSELFIGINQTIFEENYRSIPEVKKLAESFAAAYRGFIGLAKRPLYTGTREWDYGLVNLSDNAKRYVKNSLENIYRWQACFNSHPRFFEEVIIRHYVKGQIEILESKKPMRHKCMSLFTHFRLNPNGDIITCSYDLDVLGNIKKESYSAIIGKEETKSKFKQVRECGRCWLGCEVSPSWVSSLCLS